jgi:hypothetical protein
MIIALTWAEMQIAYMVAGQRRIMNMKKRLPGKYGAPEKEGSEELDLIAARGEMAVAKALNLYWSGTVGDYGAIDVGGCVEVRSRTKDWHALILHPEDQDDLPFVLADVSAPPNIRLVGWLYGKEGKSDRFWSDPSGKNRPAFFIEQKHLHPMNELIKKFGARND